jgi:hypothetical protein
LGYGNGTGAAFEALRRESSCGELQISLWINVAGTAEGAWFEVVGHLEKPFVGV